MGKHIVHFRCHSCGYCCTDAVCRLTPRDAVRIAKATGKHPLDFLEFRTPDQMSDVADTDPTWLECGDERYMMVIRHVSDRCFFLDERTVECGIYDTRPALCRLFPFKLHLTRNGEFRAFSLHKDCGCPRYLDGTVDAQDLYRLFVEDDENQDDYIAMVAAFNEVERDEPEEFVRMLIER